MATCGRVASLARMADASCLQSGVACHAVDERRLPDSRRTKETVRPAGNQEFSNLIQPGARHVAERDYFLFDSRKPDPADQ